MTTRGGGAVVLAAHGSADPAAAATTRALARAVAAARPGLDVYPAFLDHAGPRPTRVLARLAAAGCRRATLVPLLLTSAYHHRVDLPAMLAEARAAGLCLPVTVADVLGPATGADPVPVPLLAALRHRLAAGRTQFDAVVLAAAGTRDPAAQAAVVAAATALGQALGVPCQPGYASAAAPTITDTIRSLHTHGSRRVAAAAYFLAPGQLYTTATAAARAAGAVTAAEPLGTELVQLVLTRLDAAAATAAARPRVDHGVSPACRRRVGARNSMIDDVDRSPGSRTPRGHRLRGVCCWSVLGFRMSGRGGGCHCGA